MIDMDKLFSKIDDLFAALPTYLGAKDYFYVLAFYTHLLLHAVLTLVILSLPIPAYFGIVPLLFGIVKELYIDGNINNLKDPKFHQDIVARCLGSIIPLISVLWRH